MWIFTTEGFVSAVQHRNQPDSLMIRARSIHALEALREISEAAVERTPTADYPFRLTVTRGDFARWLDREVHAVNYFNFKDAAHGLGDKRYDAALMQVWSAMYDSEADDTRGDK